MDWLAGRIVHQPVFVVLVHPRALRYLKGRSPDAGSKPEATNLVFERTHSAREQNLVRGRVLAARILVALVDMEVGVAEVFQILREPFCIGKSRGLIEAEIISGPAPPSGNARPVHAGVMQFSDRPSIRLKLLMIIRANADKQRLGRKILITADRQAQFDLILRRSITERILFCEFSGSGGINFVPGDVVFRDTQAKNGSKLLRRQGSEKKAPFRIAVVD